MRFVCGKCDSKYAIADDKVVGKVVRIRCRTCGAVIVVRSPQARRAVESAPAADVGAPKRVPWVVDSPAAPSEPVSAVDEADVLGEVSEVFEVDAADPPLDAEPVAAPAAEPSAPRGLAAIVAEPERTGGWVWILGGVVVVAAAAVLLYVLVLSQPSKRPGGESPSSPGAMAPDDTGGVASLDMAAAMDAPEASGTREAPGEQAEASADESTMSERSPDGAKRRRRRLRRRRRRNTTAKDVSPMPAPPGVSLPMFVGFKRMGGSATTSGPTPSTGTATTASGGRPSGLGSVVRRNLSRLRRCYERAAKLDAQLRRVRLVIRVKVSQSGRVRAVSMSPGHLAAHRVGRCARGSINTWSFPKHGSDYSYRFVASFRPGG